MSASPLSLLEIVISRACGHARLYKSKGKKQKEIACGIEPTSGAQRPPLPACRRRWRSAATNSPAINGDPDRAPPSRGSGRSQACAHLSYLFRCHGGTTNGAGARCPPPLSSSSTATYLHSIITKSDQRPKQGEKDHLVVGGGGPAAEVPLPHGRVSVRRVIRERRGEWHYYT